MSNKTHNISVFKFFEVFPDESSARVYLENQMWGNEPVCPYCGEKYITNLHKEGVYRCKSKECKKDFTVRVGTVMYKSKVPLRKWLYAMYMVVYSRKGVSSLQLSKKLGITQKSAWFLLQRIKEAYSDDNVIKLNNVDIDETCTDDKKNNKYWTVLKRSYVDIFHNISVKHLVLYVNEFVFMLNKGNVKVYLIGIICSMTNGIIGKRLT